MKLLFSIIALSLISISPVFAESFDKIIFSDGKEYEIDTIIEEYKMSKNSQIVKTQGFTTTGEMFFLRVSPTFEKVMLLDTFGNWQKAELKERIVESVEPVNPVIAEKKTDLHILLEQHDRVYNKSEYKFFVKTFDKSLYSGSDFQNFEGKVSGAKVSAIVIDSNGQIREDFEGVVEHGLLEGAIYVPENLWQRGWYTLDMMIEYEGKFYPVQLSFYVYGVPLPSDDLSCPEGQSKVNGVCV